MVSKDFSSSSKQPLLGTKQIVYFSENAYFRCVKNKIVKKFRCRL